MDHHRHRWLQTFGLIHLDDLLWEVQVVLQEYEHLLVGPPRWLHEAAAALSDTKEMAARSAVATVAKLTSSTALQPAPTIAGWIYLETNKPANHNFLDVSHSYQVKQVIELWICYAWLRNAEAAQRINLLCQKCRQLGTGLRRIHFYNFTLWTQIDYSITIMKAWCISVQ